MSPNTEVRPIDFRLLMKRVEQLVREIQTSDETGQTIHRLADSIIAHFRAALGFYGGRLYQWDGEAYLLTATFPDAKPVEGGLRVPPTYAPIEIALAASKGVLASRLNITREHFSRILHDLTTAGLIKVRGRTVHILDVERLRGHST